MFCSCSSNVEFNACRAPWRLAVYYHQSRDSRILPLLKAQLKFFETQKLISAGYKLDGTALETYSNIAFQAPVWCLFKVPRREPNWLEHIQFMTHVQHTSDMSLHL